MGVNVAISRASDVDGSAANSGTTRNLRVRVMMARLDAFRCTVLNALRSRLHSRHGDVHVTVALRFASNNSASSPKSAPHPSMRMVRPLTVTSNDPFSTMKTVDPLSPCSMTLWPASMSIHSIDRIAPSITWSRKFVPLIIKNAVMDFKMMSRVSAVMRTSVPSSSAPLTTSESSD